MVRTLDRDAFPTLEVMFPNQDWMLSPRAMRGYLQYRLHVVDRQIDGLMYELSRGDVPPFPNDMEDEALSEDTWARWARLNYLMRARDTLQDALSWSRRKPN